MLSIRALDLPPKSIKILQTVHRPGCQSSNPVVVNLLDCWSHWPIFQQKNRSHNFFFQANNKWTRKKQDQVTVYIFSSPHYTYNYNIAFPRDSADDWPFFLEAVKPGKSYTGEDSGSFEKLEKPVWRPKGRQLNKFRSMLFNIMKTNCLMSLRCLLSGLQRCFPVVKDVPGLNYPSNHRQTN